MRCWRSMRGSAVNQDGASNGLTAPNGPSQERVIRQALANAGLSPADVDAVEAHGTGTTLGDPIEAQALLATYGRERQNGPLLLGSVKSNIGHSQAAAGVAGVIKMVEAMRHGLLPATLHVDHPSPQVDWSQGAVSLLTEAEPWPESECPRRAGVSSFGVSGTNAHVILEEAPQVAESDEAEGQPAVPELAVLPFLVSAKSEVALRAQAERLRTHLQEHPELGALDVALTLALHRPRFERRAAICAGDREGLLAGLETLRGGEGAAGLIQGMAAREGRLCFVFPGQGCQWAGMGLELLEHSPVFAERMRSCSEALAPYVDWSLEEVLRAGEGAPSLERVDVLQPALFAVMVSLAELWCSYGVKPDLVIGHSQGEIAAAAVAGALSLDDAARVSALRGKALSKLAGKGGMVSVSLPRAELEELLGDLGSEVSLAAVNGPASMVLSGSPDALEKLVADCEAKGIRAKKLAVDYASHSSQIETIREELLGALSPITPTQSEIPFYSTLTAERIDTSELGPDYWYRSLREPVRFEKATRAVIAQDIKVFIEVSPHPVLAMAISETVESAAPEPDRALVVGSLRREQGGLERFFTSLAEVWARGAQVDWGAAYEGSTAKRVPLPTYVFQRERYWLLAATKAEDATSLGQTSAEHPLLGAAVALAGGEQWLFTGRLSLQTHPWLADHAVMGTVLLPGTVFVELALRAGREVDCGVLQELVLEAPLLLGEDGGVHVQVLVDEPGEDGRRPVCVYSRPEGVAGDELEVAEQPWTRYAAGTLVPAAVADSAAVPSITALASAPTGLSSSPANGLPAADLSVWPPPGAQPVGLDGLYDRMADWGIEYGPAFQGLTAAWRRGEEVFAEVSLPEAERAQAGLFVVHPALLDAALHTMGLREGLLGSDGEAHQVGLPFSWGDVELYAEGSGSLRVRVSPTGAGEVSLVAVDETGAPVVSVGSLVMRPVSAVQLAGAGGAERDALLCLEWVGVPPAASGARAGAELVVLGDENGLVANGLTWLGVFARPESLAEAVDGGLAPPGVVLLDCTGEAGVDGGLPETARGVVAGVLGVVQGWLSDERFASSRLVVVTRGAVAATAGDDVGGLGQSGVWGLVRSAQAESPGRLVLVDVDGNEASWGVLAGALGLDEPQLALRDGRVLVPRLVRMGPSGALAPPLGEPAWRLHAAQPGTIEGLELVGCPEAAEPLGAGEVRVAVRAAGLNFRDVLIALDVYPGEATIGSEGAGVVLEVAPDVEGLAVGDRVMGLLPGAFGPIAVADRRVLERIPESWSFAQAASAPMVFLTAYYGLVDLAGLGRGERVLIHAGTGGVGMAAVQLAQHLGAEVFATASPGKWEVLRSLGLDEAHIASSRTLEFKHRFLDATDGEGMDVVLNSLAREFVDASLELLSRGGRFIEMGKTDIRDPREVGESHAGVVYRAFDLIEAGPQRIQEMLIDISGLFERGALRQLPVKAWDIRRAPDAFRYVSQARHVGKNVLVLPTAIDPRGTVLITGGTGRLGSLLARHLVEAHGLSSLVLASRSGPEAESARELQSELEGLGAKVTIAACDVSDREELQALFDRVPEEHPLTAVVHAAGALDDSVISSLTPERLDRTMVPKVDGAWHLHELTRHLDLQAFVLFSSAAGVLGSAGQGNYAAANAFLDSLAAYRRTQGLAATSLAWGLWADPSGMTGHLQDTDLARLARMGTAALSAEEGLELFDAGYASSEALTAPVRVNTQALRALVRAGALPALLQGLVRAPPRRAQDGAGGRLKRRLAGAPEAEREQHALEALCAEAAAVLGHASADAIDSQLAFKDLGFDSLTAVELRNRLNTITGLRLPATLVFDYPTPAALAKRIVNEVEGVRASPGRAARRSRPLDEPIAIVGMSCRYPGGVRSPEELWELVGRRRRRDRGVPGGPGLGPGAAVRSRSRPRRHQLHARGRVLSTTRLSSTPDFFGISPREALAMDPQQRLLLEVAWEALEDAGIDPALAARQPTGVFAGVMLPATTRRPRRARCPMSWRATRPPAARPAWSPAGSPTSSGLEGPAVTVDTACSSSLVALHLACQALRAGECSLALAGGVTVMATPTVFVEFSRQRGLAPTGAASRSPRRRRRRAGPRARASCCWSGCPTRSATATGCWRWCAAARSTRTARATG